ncbi:hypothetical protein FACS189451_02530 [Bacteroidia bacterium]|nr:hypothetical protein FACS189451_02530 [Bacteroidia bacterium]
MNASIKTFLAVVFCLAGGGISAQNIKVFFPQYIGKEYVFVLNEGAKRDTVQHGIVGETGNVIVNLTIPEKYKGHTGIGHWSIINEKGINFVTGNEDFSVTCQDAVPDSNNTVYEGSAENERMNRYESELSSLFQKVDSIFKAENMAENRNSLPPSLLKGMEPINQEYSAIRQQLTSDSSYAAFFWRTLNYIRGLGNRIYYKPGDEKDYFSDYIHYLTDDVDVTRLYYSGLWSPAITTTFNSSEDKTVWGENMVKILKRTNPQRIFDALSYDLVIICEQFGWSDAEQVIIAYLESSGRLPADPANLVNRAILQSKVKIGDKAPALNGEIPANALLIFYESGCQHCQHQLAEITGKYAEIVEKGYRVISISTDESQEVYEYHSKNFPWPDKLCDFKGFSGENLKNYGVVGTPTLYLIDKNGIILDRQPRLEDIKALNLNNPPAP